MLKKIRFWVTRQLILLSLMIIDKRTLEGLSLLMALDDWGTYINSNQIKEHREKYGIK